MGQTAETLLWHAHPWTQQLFISALLTQAQRPGVCKSYLPVEPKPAWGISAVPFPRGYPQSRWHHS
jgi:hypothetical protein